MDIDSTQREPTYKHTEGQVMYELMACLGRGRHISLYQYVMLQQLDLATDDADAAELLQDMTPEEAAADMEAIYRVYEIIAGGADDTAPKGKTSDYPPHGPEWLCDIVAKACHAIPSMTWDQVLDMPMVAVLHLAAAGGRMEGMITKRPLDMDEAWRLFQEWDDKRLQDAGNKGTSTERQAT